MMYTRLRVNRSRPPRESLLRPSEGTPPKSNMQADSIIRFQILVNLSHTTPLPISRVPVQPYTHIDRQFGSLSLPPCLLESLPGAAAFEKMDQPADAADRFMNELCFRHGQTPAPCVRFPVSHPTASLQCPLPLSMQRLRILATTCSPGAQPITMTQLISLQPFTANSATIRAAIAQRTGAGCTGRKA